MNLFIKIMIWIFSSLVTFACFIMIIGLIVSKPGYQGARTDHFDGNKFHNIGDVPSKTFFDVMKWYFNRNQGEWNEVPESEVTFAEKPDARISDSLVITYVNHSTFLIQTEGLNILTDPVWSNRVSPFSFAGPKRFHPPGIHFEDLPEIDLVIISHNHYDHLDIKTLQKLNKSFDPLFVVPLGVEIFLNDKGISNTLSLDWWEQNIIADSLTINSVPAQHFSARGLFDRDKTLWGGYVLETSSGNIYFAGDTGYGDFLKEIGNNFGPMKVSLIPIGAYKPRWFMKPMHLDPEEALLAHKDVRSTFSVGMHYGTFPLADDGQLDPITDLRKALKTYEKKQPAFQLMNEGEKIIVN